MGLSIGLAFWIVFLVVLIVDIYRLGGTWAGNRLALFILIFLLGLGAFGSPIK